MYYTKYNQKTGNGSIQIQPTDRGNGFIQNITNRQAMGLYKIQPTDR